MSSVYPWIILFVHQAIEHLQKALHRKHPDNMPRSYSCSKAKKKKCLSSVFAPRFQCQGLWSALCCWKFYEDTVGRRERIVLSRMALIDSPCLHSTEHRGQNNSFSHLLLNEQIDSKLIPHRGLKSFNIYQHCSRPESYQRKILTMKLHFALGEYTVSILHQMEERKRRISVLLKHFWTYEQLSS